MANPVLGLEVDLWLRQAAGHLRAGEIGKAVQLYRRVLARQPRHPAALLGMGDAALQTGTLDVAEGFVAQAAGAAPRSPGPVLALARIRRIQGRPAEAIALCRKALTLGKREAATHVLLGEAQLDAGENEAATASFRRALKLDPGHQLAAHMLAALTDGEAAPRNTYVRELFDYYAGIFDTHLTTTLAYDVPARMRAVLDAALPDRAFERALDLGCGTGLVAEALAGRVGAIDGIDIAPAMIEAARARDRYRHLEAAEIGDYLARASTEGAYDLVTAADVFIYVGRLEGIVPGVARALRPCGHFVFSVEETAAADVAIRSSGRFAHGLGYLDGLARGAGLTPVRSEAVGIRKEHGVPIPGRILLYVRT